MELTMKKLWLLPAIAGPLQSIHAQVEHAPTVEQCRADQKSWYATLEDEAAVANVGYQELQGWFLEMVKCEKVDSERERWYMATHAAVGLIQGTRLRDFLKRHNLWNQFLAEDAEGKR
jgi:hypothetical protein